MLFFRDLCYLCPSSHCTQGRKACVIRAIVRNKPANAVFSYGYVEWQVADELMRDMLSASIPSDTNG